MDLRLVTKHIINLVLYVLHPILISCQLLLCLIEYYCLTQTATNFFMLLMKIFYDFKGGDGRNQHWKTHLCFLGSFSYFGKVMASGYNMVITRWGWDKGVEFVE